MLFLDTNLLLSVFLIDAGDWNKYNDQVIDIYSTISKDNPCDAELYVPEGYDTCPDADLRVGLQ